MYIIEISTKMAMRTTIDGFTMPVKYDRHGMSVQPLPALIASGLEEYHIING
ncbi:MAG: hypothetical protein Q6373_007340 [Candidatus Sigynarchaeota archaeon]